MQPACVNLGYKYCNKTYYRSRVFSRLRLWRCMILPHPCAPLRHLGYLYR